MPEPDKVARSRADRRWASLFRVSGAAGLAAGLLFRRNIAAEISLFVDREPPSEIGDWFALLHANRLLGLAYLNAFDLLNCILIALVLLGLFAALQAVSRSAMTVCLGLGFLGVATYLASNTSLSMLALGDAYASATTGAQRAQLEASGNVLLWANRFAAGAHPGAGGFTSLLLVATAGLIASVVMFSSVDFGKVAPIVGILAGAADIVYCILYLTVPVLDAQTLALVFMPVAGLLWMVWHMVVGWKLWVLGGAP